MNNTESSMTGMKHKDVIKLNTVVEDGLYRYLYQPG